MTDFCHSEYSKCPPVARMQTWRRLAADQWPGVVNTGLPVTLFRSSPHISQTLHQISHILHFYLVDSSLNYATNFMVS